MLMMTLFPGNRKRVRDEGGPRDEEDAMEDG